MKLTYKDECGAICGSCEIDLKDKEIENRASDIARLFELIKLPRNHNKDYLRVMNNLLEGSICYLLGYDAKKELFGVIPGMAINCDGKLFANIVLDEITERIELNTKHHGLVNTRKSFIQSTLKNFTTEELLEEIKRRTKE